MNKSFIMSILFAVALSVFLPCVVSADDLSMHEATSSEQGCDRCHQVHKSLGSGGYNNICLNCHRLGRIEQRMGRTIEPFSQGDMATSQGPSQGVLDSKRTQSSHRWEGSAVVPRAGADEPINQPDMMVGPRNAYAGKLYCARCHGIHLLTTPAPFLRVQNDQDQLCLNCHRSRNTNNHLTGTHPVNMNYATIASQAPAEYNTTPINSNPANYTSDMAQKLPGGKVLCSTCHSVHYGDSNSRTFDNASSAKFYGLSTSKGYLLRTDLYGRTAKGLNICTNCHRTTDEVPPNPNAKVMNHNGKAQNIQCADCHGGHVDEADGTTPNAFLVRRFMAISSAAGRNPKVMFQYTGSQRNYNKDAYGVCVACHTTLPPAISQHIGNSAANSCNSCHKHKNGFSANCTSCHGMPPGQSAPGYSGNDTTSPHMSHAGGTNNNFYMFSCDQCHKGNNHLSANTYQDVFIDRTGIIAGSAAAYVSPVCSTVYCHSDGVGNYKTVTWTNGKDTIIAQPASVRCASCHALQPATNAHTIHINSSYVAGCVTCHADTVSSNTVLLTSARAAGGKHVNAVKDVKFSGTIGTLALSGSSCATVYCHSNGKNVFNNPNWSNPAADTCGTCHLTSTLNSDGHQAHLARTYGPILNGIGVLPAACNSCHSNGTFPTQHLDGQVQTPTNCTSLCHKSGGVTWSNTARLACSSCHGGTSGQGTDLSVIYGITAPDTSRSSQTGHGASSITGYAGTYAGANKLCSDCHNADSAHISSDPLNHAKRLVTTLSGSALNDECNYCHNNFASVNSTPRFLNMSTHFTNYTTTGPRQTMQCAKCHDLHGTDNLSMIRSYLVDPTGVSRHITYTNRQNQWIDQVTNYGLCQVCHTQTKFYKAGVPETGHPTEGCFTCHPHNASGGAFAPSGSCNACHGYPPVPKSYTKGRYIAEGLPGHRTTFGGMGNYTNARYEDYSGGGGAHVNHVPTYAKATEGWSNCGICHNNGNMVSSPNHKTTMPLKNNISNVTIKIAQYVNFNNTALVTYTGAKLVNPPLVNQTGSCINVGCHFQPTPRWSTDR